MIYWKPTYSFNLFSYFNMKLKLNLNDLADNFFENTRMLGLVASVKDYQFCWYLNQLLRFDFRINNDIEIQLFKNIIPASEPANIAG